MKPNRVPDDLIEAGFDAIRAWYAAHPDPNSYLDDRTQMRLVLAAALTLYNEQVEQPLRERAETAEAQLKALMQYTHEIGEVQAGLPTLEAAMARASYWQALQRATAEGARRWQVRAETAERKLAEVRKRVGTESFQWGVQGVHGMFAVDDEAAARWHTHLPTEPMTAVRRVVGEWKVPEQQTEERA